MNYWWLLPITAAFGLWFLRRSLRSKVGRARFDRFRLRMPVFGKVNRLVAVSRFSRTLSTLLVSGVPIVTALGIVEKVVNNSIIADAVRKAADNIQEGQSIAGPLRQSGEFPPMVIHMIGIGEKTGELETMLVSVSDAYDSQVDATVTALTSILGPMVIIALGLVVFVVAIAMLLPMSQITKSIL